MSERKRTYSSPGAFRRALTDKLKTVAESSRWTLPQLQRQMTYDRFLERLYLIDEGWVVKGATALLAREIGVRATIDIDVYRAVEHEVAEVDIARAAALDIGDYFRFDIGPTRAHSDGAAGSRFPVTAYVGATRWAQFHVDLVGSNLRMTGEPDEMPALFRVMMPDITQHGYRVYPLVDHVADKVAAIIERHGDRPSTRFKDLVDLVAIITEASVDAGLQRAAMHSEVERRGVVPPDRFDVPDRALWEMGYKREAQRSLLPLASTLDEALGVVTPFINAVFDGTAIGHWDPTTLQWRAETTF
ncbi:hypothetical protein AXFE_35480 [Acidithrix ferrooxidans]|uniref:Nucleotidyl transferase AbiEii toxin, Type IV TA system n=2 Tax=Acidimicrobiaceae TaxID=84994 RepID=A0A0D8HEW6_9ACTN|nr:hypothetical protein AXFE_35480 [Acidithrix ferrooxidans]